ncbi:tRNA methyltransferase complex subunit Cpd1 [Phakopsora pachyrhizi]|uniref:tRNA (adenine(58)-N(1))-methyltransferase catalytic subunit TRM61 n=1 Tax=Phakopsora pachyrhizi TaxID=170000 RepID=A0AAV0AN62_PHAPC|nr:tRNA methyltransferase complex subunit Cpd1 [Phakopsora pachyrhizi]
MEATLSFNNIFTIRSQSIQVGDTVIVYKSRDNLSSIVIEPGKNLITKFGEFLHDDLIGLQFGSKCLSRTGSGFTYLLRPTPELWTLALPHRTQILYHPDISFITSYLDIKPGSVVIEAGTGSGSFSHSIARTIGCKGKLFSFEFHEERYEKARSEFKSHGLLSNVGGPIRLEHRNVIKNGFGSLKDEFEGTGSFKKKNNLADSVFLDLPAPWDALEDAKRVMNRSQISRICCFSPCIEQVQKTCQTLQSLGFSEIVMFETLLRTHEPVSFQRMRVEDVIKKLENIEVKKEARKKKQRLEAQKRKNLKTTSKASNTTTTDATEIASDKTRDLLVTKISNLNDDSSAKETEYTGSVIGEESRKLKKDNDDLFDENHINSCKPAVMSRGHTSFLTFAILLPLL